MARPQLMHSAPSRSARAREPRLSPGPRLSRGNQADDFQQVSHRAPLERPIFSFLADHCASASSLAEERARSRGIPTPRGRRPAKPQQHKTVDGLAKPSRLLPPLSRGSPFERAVESSSRSSRSRRGKKWLTSSPASSRKRAPPNGAPHGKPVGRKRVERHAGPRQRSPFSEQPLGL